MVVYLVAAIALAFPIDKPWKSSDDRDRINQFLHPPAAEKHSNNYGSQSEK